MRRNHRTTASATPQLGPQSLAGHSIDPSPLDPSPALPEPLNLATPASPSVSESPSDFGTWSPPQSSRQTVRVSRVHHGPAITPGESPDQMRIGGPSRFHSFETGVRSLGLPPFQSLSIQPLSLTPSDPEPPHSQSIWPHQSIYDSLNASGTAPSHPIVPQEPPFSLDLPDTANPSTSSARSKRKRVAPRVSASSALSDQPERSRRRQGSLEGGIGDPSVSTPSAQFGFPSASAQPSASNLPHYIISSNDHSGVSLDLIGAGSNYVSPAPGSDPSHNVVHSPSNNSSALPPALPDAPSFAPSDVEDGYIPDAEPEPEPEPELTSDPESETTSETGSSDDSSYQPVDSTPSPASSSRRVVRGTSSKLRPTRKRGAILVKSSRSSAVGSVKVAWKIKTDQESQRKLRIALAVIRELWGAKKGSKLPEDDIVEIRDLFEKLTGLPDNMSGMKVEHLAALKVDTSTHEISADAFETVLNSHLDMYGNNQRHTFSQAVAAAAKAVAGDYDVLHRTFTWTTESSSRTKIDAFLLRTLNLISTTAFGPDGVGRVFILSELTIPAADTGENMDPSEMVRRLQAMKGRCDYVVVYFPRWSKLDLEEKEDLENLFEGRGELTEGEVFTRTIHSGIEMRLCVIEAKKYERNDSDLNRARPQAIAEALVIGQRFGNSLGVQKDVPIVVTDGVNWDLSILQPKGDSLDDGWTHFSSQIHRVQPLKPNQPIEHSEGDQSLGSSPAGAPELDPAQQGSPVLNANLDPEGDSGENGFARLLNTLVCSICADRSLLLEGVTSGLAADSGDE